MSSAQALFTPSSVLNNENVLSINLKQLYIALSFCFGEYDLSIFWNSLMADSQRGLLIESFGIPNAYGSTHCRLLILQYTSYSLPDCILLFENITL